MRIGSLALTAAAAMLMAQPVVAEATRSAAAIPAQGVTSGPLAVSTAGEPVDGSELGALSGGSIVLPAIAIIAVLVGIILIADSDDSPGG